MYALYDGVYAPPMTRLSSLTLVLFVLPSLARILLHVSMLTIFSRDRHAPRTRRSWNVRARLPIIHQPTAARLAYRGRRRGQPEPEPQSQPEPAQLAVTLA